MRLTLFEILFGAIVVVLAFLPIIFLVYLKHHSEVLKNFELRRNRQTFRYKFFLILLGISISAFYFLVFTLTFGMLYFPVFLASLAGTLLSGWVMYLLCKKFDTHSCSTLLISAIVLFVFLSIDLLAPAIMLGGSLFNTNTIYSISFGCLTIYAFWLKFHPFPHTSSSIKSVDSTTPSESESSVPASDSDKGSTSTIGCLKADVFSDSELPVESIPVNLVPESVVTVGSPTPTENTTTKKSIHVPKKLILFTSFVFIFALGIVLGYLTGGGYLSPDFVPNSPYIQKLQKAESDASSKGYKKGYHDGRDDGYIAGKEYGYKEGYHEGYDDGASDELALLLDDYFG